MLNIFEQVKNAKVIGITAHIRPDGDAIGSTLGMYLYLKKRLPGSDIKVYLDPVDDSFSMMPAVADIISSPDVNKVFDAFIIIDCDRERTGDYRVMADRAVTVINIDHHISNKDGSGDINYVVPHASSASELVFNTMDKEYIDSDIASLLYMGIAHDTGVFRFNNTKPDTLRCVADLLEYEFDASNILDVTFFEKTLKQNKIQGEIVLASRLYCDGRLIVGVATEDIIEKYAATKYDFDGVVNQLLLTKGVETAIFMYPKSEGVYKLSLRSCTDTVDVSAVTMKIGGGGHVRAAGADFTGTWQEAEKTLVDMISPIFNK